MFEKPKNIETAFQHIRNFSVVLVCTCCIVSCYALYLVHQTTLQSEQRIFVLAGGKVWRAEATERKDNIPVEARDHVRSFHEYFFSLDPDEKVIATNIGKALYLSDGSAKKQYDNLKEAGYFINLISGNISQQIETDSITIETASYPYYFRYWGKQTLLRTTSVMTKRLITEGFLRNVSRSDNNPHGFLIERWRIIDNSDISIENRK